MAKKNTGVARETSADPSVSLSIQAAPAGTPEVQRDGAVRVWMPPERAPGVRAFGELVPGTVYSVSATEAHRLVVVKGFRFASAADQVAVCNWIDGIADAIDATHASEQE